MLYARILHIYSLVSIYTFAWMLKTFVTCLYKYQAICDNILRMTEYLLMGKYALVGFRTLILYDIIDRIYVQTGNLSRLLPFLLFYV